MLLGNHSHHRGRMETAKFAAPAFYMKTRANNSECNAIIIPVSILFPCSYNNTDASKSHAYPCHRRHYFTQ